MCTNESFIIRDIYKVQYCSKVWGRVSISEKPLKLTEAAFIGLKYSKNSSTVKYFYNLLHN